MLYVYDSRKIKTHLSGRWVFFIRGLLNDFRTYAWKMLYGPGYKKCEEEEKQRRQILEEIKEMRKNKNREAPFKNEASGFLLLNIHRKEL
jgi:hypothetical protein